jgi:hypothetical protein
MKKLFLFAALLMTGFAFYSCDDVVDNPAQDPASVWNYSVSVKFDAFDFTNQATDPVTGEDNVYKVPTTLYVLNEENTLMGTITTDAAPTVGNYGTYAGTLTGTIGNNLIITTKIGNDLAKQDGTMASAIENGIIQTATVPIKIYNANSGTLTTASAKMENTATIAHIASSQIKGGDKITFVADDQPFEWTVYEEFNTPATSQDLYIAIPTSADPEAEYTISTDSKDGYTRGLTLKLADYPSLAKGKVSIYLGYPQFIETGVDLTVYDAYQREHDTGTYGYMWNISNGNVPSFSQKVEDGKTFIIKQSGDKTLDSLNVFIFGTTGEEINLTLDNIRLGKERQLQLGSNDGWFNDDGTQFVCENGAKINVTLTGENKFDRLSLYCPHTAKGDGTWAFKRLELNSYGKRTVPYGWDWSNEVYTKAGAASFTIDKEMVLESVNVNDGAILNINKDTELTNINLNESAKLNVADGVTLNVKNEEDEGDVYVRVDTKSTLKIGKGATFNLVSKAKDTWPFNVGNDGIFELADGTSATDGATVIMHGAKNNTLMELNKATWKIGKYANVEIVGDTKGKTGRGIYIAGTNISVAENANVVIKGIDDYAMQVSDYTDWSTSPSTQIPSKIEIADKASFNLETTEGGIAAQIRWGADITIDGKGTFTAKSEENNAITINGSSKLTFKGGKSEITGGKNKPAIKLDSSNSDVLTIKETITNFKAISGMTSSPICILDEATDAEITKALIGTADADKFIDTTAEGVRTITPKPAAE